MVAAPSSSFEQTNPFFVSESSNLLDNPPDTAATHTQANTTATVAAAAEESTSTENIESEIPDDSEVTMLVGKSHSDFYESQLRTPPRSLKRYSGYKRFHPFGKPNSGKNSTLRYNGMTGSLSECCKC